LFDRNPTFCTGKSPTRLPTNKRLHAGTFEAQFTLQSTCRFLEPVWLVWCFKQNTAHNQSSKYRLLELSDHQTVVGAGLGAKYAHLEPLKLNYKANGLQLFLQTSKHAGQGNKYRVTG